MRSWYANAVALAMGVSAAAASLPSHQRDVGEVPVNMTNPVARGFIVEYSVDALARRDDVLAAVDDLTVVKTYNSAVFSGASILTDSETLDSLARFPGIVRVWPNQHVFVEPVIESQSFSDSASALNYTTHNATGVSKLHDMGFFGEGAKVGVVDTGIWYKHEALGGCFGQGCKVVGGYDFVGNAHWPYEEKSPDDDPLDQQGHGTHVSGIIAGQHGEWAGVAPKASLYGYKVFSLEPGTTEDVLIDAFIRAYEDGMDIITSSIGSVGGWSDNAWAEVASRIAREGVIVTISAGNSGSAGAFFASSGASGTDVIAVASVETEVFPASPFEATFSLGESHNTTKIGYLPSTYYFGPEVQGWPIVVLNFDTADPADACEPYPEDTPVIGDAIPLVRRGTCTFATKQANLQALGARYVLFYNNGDPLITPGTVEEGSLIGMITSAAGEAMIQTVKGGGNVTVDFSVNPEQPVGLEYPAGGRPNDFTSWGGTYDFQIKPDIAAPGGNIFSTYPDGAYAVMSGTSMACPYVAGVAALYIGAFGGRKQHGKGFSKMLAQRIISSGTALPWYDGAVDVQEWTAPVPQVGNGLIDAFKVLKYSSSLEFDKIALNDTHHFSRYHDVTITNGGKQAVSYSLSYQPAAGVEAAGWFPLPPTVGEYRLKSLSEMTPIPLEPEISLPRDFVLKPGQTKTVSVNFDNPDKLGWNSTALPLYSGKIIVSASNGEQLSVPYAGLAANLKAEMDSMYRTTYPFSRSNVQFISIEDKPWYTFDLGLSQQDFPKIYSKNVWGTREVRWDIFEPGWKERQWRWPLVEGEDGYIGPVASWVGAGQSSYFNPALSDPNETFTYPRRDLSRNAQTTMAYHEFWWFGKLGNGSQIEPGNYTMRFATLKPFGRHEAADNWEVYETPEIEVRGKYE